MKPPISEPFSTRPAARETRMFRGDFFRFFAGYFCAFTLILLPALGALSALSHLRIPFLYVAVAVFAATLLASAISLFYAIEVSAEGLRGFDFWWIQKRAAKWHEITGAKNRWFLFPYAVISTAKRHNLIWMPLCLADGEGFVRAVEELAPVGNPLRLLLGKTRVKSVHLR